MTKNEELKPCPYCGNKNPTIEQMDLHLFEVGCHIYSCNMPFCIIASDEKSAVDAWNHMVDDVINKRKDLLIDQAKNADLTVHKNGLEVD